MSDKSDHLGHRRRLRERFLAGGADAIADYELMEMVLFAAYPRGDVKPLAKRLLKEFGGFAEAVNAPADQLKKLDGVGDSAVAALKAVNAAALRLIRAQVLEKPVIGSWDALLDYCHAGMAYQKKEQFRILFLDRRNVLIADEVQQEGTIDHTPVYPREVVKRALELGATALIMVHNHPSGDPTPSRSDIDMTNRIIEAGKNLGITVHDHIIVGRGNHTSFKTLGLI